MRACLFVTMCIAGLLMGIVPTAEADDVAPVFAKYRVRVQKSVDRGLAWLAKQQFTEEKAQQLGMPILVGSLAQQKPGNTGVHGLAVMTFLAKGHTPGQGPYGDVLNRAIDFTLNQQAENGLLICKNDIGRTHGHVYSHSISTLMPAEVSGMVDPKRQQHIDIVLSKAIALILKAQQVEKPPEHAGGWRYEPTSKDSDMSLTGWAVLSLRAARMNGAPVPDANIKNAINYILKCRHPATGGFGYTPNAGPNLGLTGAGVLCLTLLGQQDHEAIQPAGNHILKLKPASFSGGMNGYYDTYYASQATYQLGGKYWQEFAPWMYDNLLKIQQPDGKWPPADGTCGSTYSTAMAILAMTPPYRQLPIYQRDELPEQVTTVKAKEETHGPR